MAVAYVSDIEGIWSSGTTMTLASVAGSGGNLVIACTTWRSNTGQTCTGATYGGNAMTRIGSEITSTGASLTSFYYVPSGDGDVVFTYSAAPGNAQGTALVFSGVDTGTPIGTSATSASAATGTSTAAVTSAADGLVLDVLGLRADPTGLTIGAGQTERSAQEASSSVYHRTSTEAGAASVTMSWTWTNSMGFVHMAIPIAASAGGSVTKTPAQAVLTVNVLAPLTNAYTYVAIQDTLINESGQVVANAANIRLLVWYNGQAIGAPDYSVNGQTSNASGSISWSVAPGSLANGQAIFYLAQDSISYSNYTCGRVVPTYG